MQYQNATAPPSPLQHFWSLAVEEQFYLLWPLLIVICAVIGRRRYRRGLTILVIATLTIATLWYSIRISGSQTSLAYFSLQTRAWELGFGALVAPTANRWTTLPRGLAHLFGWTGLGAILVTAVTYSDKTVYPGVAAIVPVAGATLLIVAGVLRNSHARRPRSCSGPSCSTRARCPTPGTPARTSSPNWAPTSTSTPTWASFSRRSSSRATGACRGLQKCAGTVQERFYRWAQVSRDELGPPICVGTCAVYRRVGLERSGGFAQIGHSEDVHIGVNLMKVGFRTIYVPVVLAKGLCPDKLASFISQQYRWCAGSMSLLRDKEFHDAPLTYRQRMCFFTGFGYYISTAVGIFTLPMPTT